MRFVDILRRVVRNSDNSAKLLQETVLGIDSQSRVLSNKIEEVVRGTSNQSEMLNGKLEELIQGSANQSELLNRKLEELIQGSANQSELLGRKLEELIQGTVNQSSLLNDKLVALVERQNALIELQKIQIETVRGQLPGSAPGEARDLAAIQAPPIQYSDIGRRDKSSAETGTDQRTSFETAVRQLPLMIDAKTYNTSHPDYDANLVRNFPGKIFNADKPCSNPVYAELQKLVRNGEVPDPAWRPSLDEALAEAKSVPHANQVFERYAYVENYLKEITQRYHAHYAGGWVNLDDAVFLYWLVRKLKPTTIVQTGVCNGLSSAFMMLGLVKNGSEGRLHVIDLPPVFNSKDPAWMVRDKVYGVVIPEGKSSGWLVPDAYRNRFDVWTGDAKELLPKMVDKVDAIDLFYHDSDHTYDHMMFEFGQAKRKLTPGGLLVGDDVSWNASVWDFADRHGVPSYNFKGAVGVAFF